MVVEHQGPDIVFHRLLEDMVHVVPVRTQLGLAHGFLQEAEQTLGEVGDAFPIFNIEFCRPMRNDRLKNRPFQLGIRSRVAF